MSKNLRERAEDAAKEIQTILGVSTDDHPKEVADAVENSIIRALIAERDRCAEVARRCHADNEQKAREVSSEIARVRSVTISNLSAMR